MLNWLLCKSGMRYLSEGAALRKNRISLALGGEGEREREAIDFWLSSVEEDDDNLNPRTPETTLLVRELGDVGGVISPFTVVSKPLFVV